MSPVFFHPVAVDEAYLQLLEDDIFLAPLLDDFHFGPATTGTGAWPSCAPTGPNEALPLRPEAAAPKPDEVAARGADGARAA